MPSNLDRLRAGEPIEFEPGVSGRLNREKKKLELSSGEVLDVSRNQDLFPANDEALALSRQKEGIRKDIKGPISEFWHQYSTQGIPGGIRDWINYAGKDYSVKKAAESAISEEISEESPWISGAATAANIGTDVALTSGMSALKAAPAITLGSAGSRVLTEPGQVSMETLVAAGGGWGVDKVVGGLSSVARRRGDIRALPGQQQAVQAQNQAGLQATNQANNAASLAHTQATQAVDAQNTILKQTYQQQVAARQQQILNDTNAYRQAEAQRQANITNLQNAANTAKATRSSQEAAYKQAVQQAEQQAAQAKQAYELQMKQHKQALDAIPMMQKQAQIAYGQNVVATAKELEKQLPKNARIVTDDLGVADYIENSIRKTGYAGSKEANQATRVLNALFPEGEYIGARELSSRYKALEDAIVRAEPEVQNILTGFKKHMGERLPVVVEDLVAYTKVAPVLQRSVVKGIPAALKEVGIEGMGSEAFVKKLTSLAEANAKSILGTEVTSKNFVQRLQSGSVGRDIANKMLSVNDFLDVSTKGMRAIERDGLADVLRGEAQRQHAFFVDQMARRIDSALARAEIKGLEAASTAKKNFATNLRKTYGMADPVAPPTAPSPPPGVQMPPPPNYAPIPPVQAPPPVTPPQLPPLPQNPTLGQAPTAPIPQTFTPQPDPTLAAPQGLADRAGDFLEKNLLGGRGLVNNPITKLTGLKYVLGKAALPAEAAYLGMKGLTSPTAFGEAARMTFKQGGIQAVTSWMQSYPSFHDGILESPQDRRSFTKELEENQEIPIEQKAVMQSKVNRGVPLQAKL